MSETEGQRNDSPLLSERGVTTISDAVVSQVAGMAAQEVEGVHMGGGTSRTASGVLGSITGSESKTSGISVEVGRTETAIDLKMGIEYNKNILQTVEEVRRRITDRVESITGLRIKELNATITDITFPEQEARRRLGPESPTSDRESDDRESDDRESDDRESDDRESDDRESDDRESDSEQATDTAPEPQAAPETETDEPGETTQVEAATKTEAPDAPEEEAVGEDRPREENETTEVRTEQTVEETSEETQETRAEFPEGAATRPEPEASDPETPEARMRRRAEERARRRRGSAGDD
jgi:uncharacterized alkaline shock family protein YloU